MLVTPFFDTHENIKLLTKSGFSEEQAEGQVKVVSNLIENNLATKTDLQQLENKLTIKLQEMDNRMQKIESKMLTEILHSRSETIKWVAGMMVAQATVFAAILKIFSKA
ncbi:hypothetical protein MHK_010381 [Candidatus Magnetomorum sp. HK-1]|nr:hypothetical protein MHK_010381 [Candidatus Magnetomorum sp. HK-1]